MRMLLSLVVTAALMGCDADEHAKDTGVQPPRIPAPLRMTPTTPAMTPTWR